jgi:hypothetical protein
VSAVANARASATDSVPLRKPPVAIFLLPPTKKHCQFKGLVVLQIEKLPGQLPRRVAQHPKKRNRFLRVALRKDERIVFVFLLFQVGKVPGNCQLYKLAGHFFPRLYGVYVF